MRRVILGQSVRFSPLKGHFSKYATIANPRLGDEFLEEVSQTTLCNHWNSCDGSCPFH
jgi:hypothetical protein